MGGKLSDADKQLIKAYIEHGRFPAAEAAAEAAQLEREKAIVTPQGSAVVVFRKACKAPAPAVKNGDQAKTDIDKFILAKLEEKGWEFSSRGGPGQPHSPRVFRSDRLASDASRGESLRG
jgi:hypothetical protein